MLLVTISHCKEKHFFQVKFTIATLAWVTALKYCRIEDCHWWSLTDGPWRVASLLLKRKAFLAKKKKKISIFFYSKPLERVASSSSSSVCHSARSRDHVLQSRHWSLVLHPLTVPTGKQGEQRSRTVRGTSRSHNNSLCSSEDAWDSQNFNNK